MKVERVGDACAAEWEAYVAAHPESTVYHRYAWRAIFGETFGYRSFYLVARGDDGAISGCLPLFLVKSPFSSKRLVAVPFRDRGGPLWSDNGAFTALVSEAKAIARECGAAYVELKSIAQYPEDLAEANALREHLYWVRSTVDLTLLDRDLLRTNLSAKTRNMLRQAEQAALELRDLTSDAGGLAVWYDLHLRTQQRMGLPPFPSSFFVRMLDGLRDAGAVKLFAVMHEGRALSATIVLLHGTRAIYGYSASAKEGHGHRPNDFMLYQVLCRLLDAGFTEFDLGSDAPAQESLLFFKRKWLAHQAPVPVYTAGNANFSLSDSSHPRYRLARRLFQHIPRPILRAIGAATTRFFG